MTTAFVCAMFCLSSGCTTLYPVTVDATGERIRSEIRTGDTVQVSMIDGTTHRLQVTAVGASSLVGDEVKMPQSTADIRTRIDLPYAEMRSVEVRRINAGKTTALVAGLALTAIAVTAAVVTGGGRHSPGFNR